MATPIPDLELTIQPPPPEEETKQQQQQDTNRLTFEECEEFFDETKANNLELVEINSPEIKICSSPPSASIFNCLYSLFFKD